FVILVPEQEAGRTSARNRLCGTVIARDDGAVNSELVLDIGGGMTIVAIITLESARALGLEVGDRACALVKASNVILAGWLAGTRRKRGRMKGKVSATVCRPALCRVFSAGLAALLAAAPASADAWKLCDALGVPENLSLAGSYPVRYEALDHAFRAG